ncbi:hypothetical protein F7018_11640 [Tenacibaculum aiptasiae]|uniref:Trimeric autotransporter adhesin YadA-like head domain-containing protein n=1 Tax=Tenacibaculum aiptasiae TaxID=426481 RepID=A0A7J5ADF3_9FLAO|nr:hypothetical protein [Tenacibaculum aiptasiae]KAB1155621.1 hypothetical protein F7018_11640 [Tenacibaculum aiptasiae]
MKQIYSLFIFIFITTVIYGQSSNTFNYQAVIRNNLGIEIKNKTIGVKISLLQGSVSGTNVYEEIHSVTSNEQGVISFSIGTGTTTDNFSTINWANKYWLQVAVDIAGGTNYAVIGSSELQSVPYSNYATKSGDKVFSTTANVTSNASGRINADDFVFGGIQLANNSTINDDDSRFFFDKSKAAFRAGITVDDIGEGNVGNQWDDANVGYGSVAMGVSTKATTEGSVSIGRYSEVTGETGYAIGNRNIVTGNYAGAFGAENKSKAEFSLVFGLNNESNSYGQTTIGYNNATVNGNLISAINTDRLFVIGNGTFLTKSNALVMLKNGNTTLNGQLTLDADNSGTGRGYTLPAQDGNINQVMITDGAGNLSWSNIGGAFSTAGNVTSNALGMLATDDFVFGSTQLDDDINNGNDNRRMFFDKSKGAFRAGATNDSSSWSDENVGFYSAAFGFENKAIGPQTFISGGFNTVNKFYGIAMGYNNVVEGQNASAIGRSLLAESHAQISIGIYNTPKAGNAISHIANDRLFVIGNGTSTGVRSDALVMLKNGNTTLNGQLTLDGDNGGNGKPYTLPAQDGSANQVMITDGLGNMTWKDYGLETVSTLAFNSGWENYSINNGSAFEDGRFYIDNNRVYLGGLVRKTSEITQGEVIFTLPIGYRPKKQRIFSVVTEAGIVRVDIAANGNVIFNGLNFNGGQNWVSLDGISFRVD